MTRTLFVASALMFAAMALPGTAGAANTAPAAGQIAALPAATVSAQAIVPVRWHYEWQYQYDKHGNWVPGWVAVLNAPR